MTDNSQTEVLSAGHDRTPIVLSEEEIVVATYDEYVEIVPIVEEIEKKELNALARMSSGQSSISMLNLE